MLRNNQKYEGYIGEKYMIYFSDLDRTLIYSDKFINEETEQVCIEILDGREISYMSPKSIDILKDILKKKKFIPTTTRSIEQYKRIMFMQNDINFEWSIVSNGGNILHNGKIFEPWNKVLQQKLKSCTSLKDVMNHFKDNYSDTEGILKMRDVDDVFFYIVVDRDIFDENSLDSFESYLKKSGWNVYVSGRKIYFIPEVVTKESAIEYLTSYLKEEKFEALGDSIMDINMLKASNKGYIPANSYIAMETQSDEGLYVSQGEGFKGIEEILCIINE